MSIEASRVGHWTISEIPYDAIDQRRARADPCLVYVVAGASFVEITSDLYAGNLADYFADDSALRQWLIERWEPEETQHGEALRRYVKAVWPELDWARAYQGFLAEYTPCCTVRNLGPTRALELASRCVVETGTATFYAALARVSPEPVLGGLAGRIRNDKHRHYNLFLYHYRHWAKAEGTGRRAVLGTLRARIGELDREDVYCAIKHVFQVLHPDRPFTSADYRQIQDHYARLIRRHYPYRTAVQMLLRPLDLSPLLQSAGTPLLALAARAALAVISGANRS